MIYLFKTHYSIAKGVIQANESKDPTNISGVPNLVDICLRNNIKKCFVVDDSMAGIWPIYKTLNAHNIPLTFGLRMNFVSDANDKSEFGNISIHKNIIFIKNEIGYKNLVKISTKAHVDFHHTKPRIDYEYYHSIASKGGEDSGLTLSVPFYDSFLYNNKLTQNQCVPDFRSLKPAMFVEDNNLPIDGPLQRVVEKYAMENGLERVKAQTVYYEKKSDAFKYFARRCMSRRNGQQRTMEKPELPGFGSDGFCLSGLEGVENKSNNE